MMTAPTAAGAGRGPLGEAVRCLGGGRLGQDCKRIANERRTKG